MGSLRLVTILLLLGGPAFAQSPTYGVGRTPTAEEIRRMDISIGAAGEELPPGRGTAKEGARVYEQKACVACHGAAGLGGLAPELQSKKGQDVPIWQRERILPLRAPFATTVWHASRE
jgi:S-disulfanyl-L-cysteine oxidoreductase SoxD